MAKILVRADGLVGVDQQALQPFGLDLGRSDLRLSTGAEPYVSQLRDVPFQIVGQGANRKLVFYGQGNASRYSADRVYWLTTGAGSSPGTLPQSSPTGRPPGAVAAASDVSATTVATATVHLEVNKVYEAEAAPQDDHWYWAPIFAPGAVTETVVLTDVRPAAAVLHLGLWSANSSNVHLDHHVRLRVSGQLLAEDKWNGIASRVITVTVPAGTLRTGDNAVSIQAPGDTGAQAELEMLNWMSVDYPAGLALHAGRLAFAGDAPLYQVQTGNSSETDGVLALDVTDPGQPLQLSTSVSADGIQVPAVRPGVRRYQIAAESKLLPPTALLPAHAPVLKTRTTGADYIAITPASLAGAVQPLLDWRKKDGLSVASIDVQDVYDEFGGGQLTPEAIRDFLRFSHEHWSPAPRFVLLVGDASYDYRNELHARNQDVLPTQLVPTQYSGETASDVWYTLLDGDNQPDVALGRLPAQTPDEVKTMVHKIMAYEQAPAGNWQKKALLVADNDDSLFRRDTDDLAARLRQHGYTADELTIAAGGQTHEQILNAISQGISILNYVGHGSLDVWGNEKVLQTKDAAGLKNGDRLPILITYTCLNGYFHHPDADSLSEAMLWQPGGGVVAAVVPSGRSLSTDQKPLAEGFYSALFDAGAPRLGEALLTAQRGLKTQPSTIDVLLTFNLLGDPALKFARPAP